MSEREAGREAGAMNGAMMAKTVNRFKGNILMFIYKLYIIVFNVPVNIKQF